MKHNLTPNAALVATPETPANGVKEPMCGRSAKMDQLLRMVNGNPRFAFDAVAVAVEAAMNKAKA